MKRPLRVLFYGVTHEHAPGKFESLRKMPDDFEIAAVVDDAPMASMYGLAKRSIPVVRQEAEERKIVRFSRPKGAAGKRKRRR